MTKNRIEAFSDGVLAIVITIMVLELEAPRDAARLADLEPLLPIFLSYVLSFIYIGIYWNNHHHLFHAATHPSGGIMWANLHLMFWLSLVPFVTAWIGENHFASVPMALYGGVLLMAALAYWTLQGAILRRHGEGSVLARAVGADLKGKLSPAIYVVGIAGSFLSSWIAGAAYVLVALMWLVPDRRIERALDGKGSEQGTPRSPTP